MQPPDPQNESPAREPSEWDSAPPTDTAAKRASLFLWILAGLEIAGCSCVAAMAGIIARMPDALVAEMIKQGHDEASLDAVRQVAPFAAVMAIIIGVLPGFAYLFLAFGVRRKKRGAVVTSLVLAFTQAIVLGIQLIANLLLSIRASDPASMTVSVVSLGSVVALLGAVIYWLFRVQSGDSPRRDDARNPWDDDSP